eukprot:COSAG05_NODE_188_length_14697_cov_11.861145_20_plen_124_part_00
MKPQESRAKIVPPYTISASLRAREPHSCLHSSQTPLRGVPSPSGDRGQGRLPPRIGKGAETTQARRADNSDLRDEGTETPNKGIQFSFSGGAESPLGKVAEDMKGEENDALRVDTRAVYRSSS